MGLDMFLDRKVQFRGYGHANKASVSINSENGESKVIAFEQLREINQRVNYWRKANAIHAWFVDNVQNGEDNCGIYNVSVEQLTELRDTCEKVLKNPELAMLLLPPRAGFFFGSTDVDEGYREDVYDTLQAIDKELSSREEIIKECGDSIWGVDYQYYSSW